MAAGDLFEVYHVTVGAVTPTTINVNGGGLQKIKVVATTADIYIDFNGRTATPNSYRVVTTLKSEDFDFTSGGITQFSILAASGTPDVYIIGIRG